MDRRLRGDDGRARGTVFPIRIDAFAFPGRLRRSSDLGESRFRLLLPPPSWSGQGVPWTSEAGKGRCVGCLVDHEPPRQGRRLTEALVIGVSVAAAAVCILLILLLRPLLIRHALAQPNARSSHKVPTPQGGGIAVIGAAFAAILAAAVVVPPLRAVLPDLGPVMASAVLLAVLGGADDIRPLGVVLRLIVQLIAVGTVVATLPGELHAVGLLPDWAQRGLLVVAGMWFVNLVNFMDGIDLMTAAEVVPVSAAMIVMGALGALAADGVMIAAALLGAMIGFCPFNRPVARLFLGDVGSLPVGLLMGWLLARLAANGHVAAALLLPGYYLGDATVTLIRRIADGEPVWVAHRTHFYQRATSSGFAVIEVVARVFAVNLGLAALAVSTVIWPGLPVTIAALAAGAVLVTWLLVSFARGRP